MHIRLEVLGTKFSAAPTNGIGGLNPSVLTF